MDKIDVRLSLLFLEYQRYVSRAHTIFTSFFEISLGILFGVFTIILALVEIEFMPWNKYYFDFIYHLFYFRHDIDYSCVYMV